MRTREFIDTYCKGTWCPDYNPDMGGCRAGMGKECDEAFNHPEYRGLKMVDRITRFVEKKGARID